MAKPINHDLLDDAAEFWRYVPAAMGGDFSCCWEWAGLYDITSSGEPYGFSVIRKLIASASLSTREFNRAGKWCATNVTTPRASIQDICFLVQHEITISIKSRRGVTSLRALKHALS